MENRQPMANGDDHTEQTYSTLNFKLGEEISFTEAQLDARYYRAGFQDLHVEDGPYHHYKVVDFPDNDSFSEWSRLGVRKDGFNGRAPLYYVRCKNVIGRELRSMGKTVIGAPQGEKVRLANGQTFHWWVKEKSADGRTGSIFYNGKVIAMVYQDGMWIERPEEPGK